MRTIKNLSTSLAAFGACGLLAACGDNLTPGGGDDEPPGDGGDPIDGDDTPPDAFVATVGGTVAVTDVTLDHPTAAALGFRGGAISISFSDLTSGGGTEVYRQNEMAPVGGCLITQFGPTGGTPNPPLDAGPVTISGPGLNGNVVGPCVFNDTTDTYLCTAAGGLDVAASANDEFPAANLVTYTFAEDQFPAAGLAGAYLSINGFDDANLNSGTGAFPIMLHASTTSVSVSNPTATADAKEEADIDFAVLTGFAPAPAGPNFLISDNVNISKPATDVWPALNHNVDVQGEGFTLDPESDDPSGFPTATVKEPLRFGCTDDGCGDISETTLQAMVVSGRATRQSVAGLFPFQMPAEDGTEEWLEFQCSQLFGDEVIMPVEAVNEIVDFGATRVELRVIRAAGFLIEQPDGVEDPNTLRLLVGHGIVGHTNGPT